jgi:hypothetical protein
MCNNTRWVFIPLDIINGVKYSKLRPPTDKELDTLPHVTITSDIDWDPLTLDNVIDTESSDWYPEEELCTTYGDHPFNKTVNYMQNVVNEFNQLSNSNYDSIDLQNTDDVVDNSIKFKYNNTVTAPKESYHELLRPRFGFLSDEIIKKTFLTTTQYA